MRTSCHNIPFYSFLDAAPLCYYHNALNRNTLNIGSKTYSIVKKGTDFRAITLIQHVFFIIFAKGCVRTEGGSIDCEL